MVFLKYFHFCVLILSNLVFGLAALDLVLRGICVDNVLVLKWIWEEYVVAFNNLINALI